MDDPSHSEFVTPYKVFLDFLSSAVRLPLLHSVSIVLAGRYCYILDTY